MIRTVTTGYTTSSINDELTANTRKETRWELTAVDEVLREPAANTCAGGGPRLKQVGAPTQALRQ